MKAKRTFLLAIFLFGIAASGLQPAALAADKKAPTGPAGMESATNPRIAPGDVLAIAVDPAEEYNREVTVQPDGHVDLALIGSLSVKDLTAREVEVLVAGKYAKFVANAKVSVTPRRFVGRKVAILGEVHSSGFFEYRDGMKLLELVSLAGGLSESARASRVQVLRPGVAEGFHFNFQAVLDGELNRDLALLPGDTIIVPKTPITKKVTWLTLNILPWLSMATLAVSVALLAKNP